MQEASQAEDSPLVLQRECLLLKCDADKHTDPEKHCSPWDRHVLGIRRLLVQEEGHYTALAVDIHCSNFPFLGQHVHVCDGIVGAPDASGGR